MRSLQHFSIYVSTLLLCAGSTAGANFDSAKQAYEQNDYAAALKELKPLSEQGNADAQVLLGKMYLMGKGVSKDPETGLRWFRAAAEQGHSDGEFMLGAMYLLPHSDIPQGLKWVRLAAEQGN